MKNIYKIALLFSIFIFSICSISLASATIGTVNIALNSTSCNATSTYSPSYVCNNLFDDNLSTNWITQDIPPFPVYAEISLFLNTSTDIGMLEIYQVSSGVLTYYAGNIIVMFSNDSITGNTTTDGNWTNITSHNYVSSIGNDLFNYSTGISLGNAKWIAIKFIDQQGALGVGLSEVKVYDYIPCVNDWIANFTTCINDTSFKTYYDANNCGNNVSLPIDNGTNVSGCACQPSWIQTATACNSNIQLINYYDNNNCNSTLNLPALNGTTQYCTIQNSVQFSPDQIVLIILGVFIIFSLVGAIALSEHFFGLCALFFGLMLSVFVTYKYPDVLSYASIFMILVLVVMWFTIHRAKK